MLTLALAASLHYEKPNSKVRVIDFAPNVDPLEFAEKVQKELTSANRFAAVGYDQELTRRIPKIVLQEPAAYNLRQISWSADDVILVTGGAKGITAECALELARTTNATMALVGSSSYRTNNSASVPDDEISRTLKRFHDAGLTARYYQCDIVDAATVDRIVAEIRQDLGDITGVIHGSALNLPRELHTVSTDEVLREVSPKVIGSVNLCRALADSPPKLFVGFSSIIGVSGMLRNGWYGFSNEALNLILQKFGEDHPGTAVLSIGFSIWDDVGMGVRMGSTNFLARLGVGAIPAQEGVRRFLHLFMNDPGKQQVIVAARLAGLDSIQPASFALPANSRFLEDIVNYYPEVEVVARARLSLEKDPYIKDHLWRGTYLFPTVFGLEAMAQAVGYVTGKTDFSNLQIEDIRLERPIPVSFNGETEIEIRAEVLEKEADQAACKVRVGIATRQTGFHLDHFSATFVLNCERDNPLENIKLPPFPLDINPKLDLYNGKLLFQGPLYHRLEKIYSLNSKRCVFSSKLRCAIDFPVDLGSDSPEKEWLLGDPYFRDSLLHSVQLPVSRDISLPLRIERLERYRSGFDAPESSIGTAIIEGQTEREITATVVTVNEDGQVIERLQGYVLKVLEHHEDYPTPEELAAPGQRDERLVEHELTRLTKQMGLGIPEISVKYLPGLLELNQKERHDRELSIVHETVGRFLADSDCFPEDLKVSWLPSGKPHLNSAMDCKVDISLSHNGCTVLCVAGPGPQGCDIESITLRSLDEWTGLLGREKEPLIQQLLDGGDTLDQAGTRIWTAREALFKATAEKFPALAIDSHNGDTVIFQEQNSDVHLRILTFPVELTRTPERMVAVVTYQTPEELPAPPLMNVNKSVAALSFDRDSYKFDIIDGPKGQPVFVFQFPVTFKEASNPSRTLYFSNYFNWLGKLR
jgi:NAD(P)-dependent dehydrogenase (short-subunit alcohol dehydrogenase family)/phosphopantetheinyl transferase